MVKLGTRGGKRKRCRRVFRVMRNDGRDRSDDGGDSGRRGGGSCGEPSEIGVAAFSGAAYVLALGTHDMGSLLFSALWRFCQNPWEMDCQALFTGLRDHLGRRHVLAPAFVALWLTLLPFSLRELVPIDRAIADGLGDRDRPSLAGPKTFRSLLFVSTSSCKALLVFLQH